MTFGSEGDIPEAVGGVAKALDDDASVFDDTDIVFGEDGYAFVVTEFADGDERPCGKSLQDVACGSAG